jgi:oligosaccharyltransferase complex subunit alpha (ribophorin I)
LAPKAQQTLAITYHLLHNLTPQPAAITQSEQQFVRADLSAYWPSAYDTLKQKTEVKLGSAGIKEYTKLPSGTSESTAELPTKAGSKLTYGPFGKVPAGAKEDVSVRYEYTKPLIHVTHLERDVEVSHWGGNIAFEERFLDLYNTAANLSKPFNRVEWAAAAFYKPSSTAVRDLTFSLPPGAKDPYFTDVIGNVSTSRFRPGHKSRDSVLEVKPRYPLFGGWKYPFTVGWNVDAGAFLKSLSSNKFILSVPFLDGPKQAEGVSYGEITLRVILPEGAKNIIWESEVVVASAEIVLHQTFMDTLGRTTLVLTVRNAVDEWRGRRVVVAYQYGVLDALRKPFVFFGGALSLFVAWWVLGSVNTGITAGRVVKGTKLKE